MHLIWIYGGYYLNTYNGNLCFCFYNNSIFLESHSLSHLIMKNTNSSFLQISLVMLAVTLFVATECRSLHSKRTDELPESFNDVKHLNNYLGDLADYYLVLGRPRFVILFCDSIIH